MPVGVKHSGGGFVRHNPPHVTGCGRMASARPAGTFGPERASQVSETAVSDDAQLIDQALDGPIGGLRATGPEVSGPAVQYGLPRGRPRRGRPRHRPGGAGPGVPQVGLVPPPQRVLHLAVPHRLQRGHDPPAATAADRVDGPPAGNRATWNRADDEDDPAESLERKERCRQVRQAIAQLAEEHRAVLVLREIDGCCYETIAEILDLPIGTVRSRLHRARLQLREELKEMLAEEGIRD